MPMLAPPNPLLAHRVSCVRTTTRAEKKILQCGVFHLERDCKRCFVSCLAIQLAKGNGLLRKGWSGSTGPLKAAVQPTPPLGNSQPCSKTVARSWRAQEWGDQSEQWVPRLPGRAQASLSQLASTPGVLE